jgi:hypothetical protein
MVKVEVEKPPVVDRHAYDHANKWFPSTAAAKVNKFGFAPTHNWGPPWDIEPAPDWLRGSHLRCIPDDILDMSGFDGRLELLREALAYFNACQDNLDLPQPLVHALADQIVHLTKDAQRKFPNEWLDYTFTMPPYEIPPNAVQELGISRIMTNEGEVVATKDRESVWLDIEAHRRARAEKRRADGPAAAGDAAPAGKRPRLPTVGAFAAAGEGRV